jgi:hypothetical protein
MYTQLYPPSTKGSVMDAYYDGCINIGVFVHTDCWKYVKNTVGINLKYSDLPILSNKFFNISYGKIEKYWSQDFMFDSAYDNNEIDLCMSPLKNIIAAKAVNKILSQLKIVKKDRRSGPSVSATFYAKGNVKIGNDGNFWQIKNGKWNRINKSIDITTVTIPYTDKKALKKLEKIPQIGDVNLTCALFVSKFVMGKKDIIVTLIQ